MNVSEMILTDKLTQLVTVVERIGQVVNWKSAGDSGPRTFPRKTGGISWTTGQAGA